MCLRFAEMERRLGEIDRARAIFQHGSQFCEPGQEPAYWDDWRAFEVNHGNEDTFRDMLRVKRAVQAQCVRVHSPISSARCDFALHVRALHVRALRRLPCSSSRRAHPPTRCPSLTSVQLLPPTRYSSVNFGAAEMSSKKPKVVSDADARAKDASKAKGGGMSGFVKGATMKGSSAPMARVEASTAPASADDDGVPRRRAVPDSVFGRAPGGADQLRKRLRGHEAETEGEGGALGALERFKRMKSSKGN